MVESISWTDSGSGEIVSAAGTSSPVLGAGPSASHAQHQRIAPIAHTDTGLIHAPPGASGGRHALRSTLKVQYDSKLLLHDSWVEGRTDLSNGRFRTCLTRMGTHAY